MNNRLTATIAGREYTLVADEETEYMKQVAQFVDEQIRAVDSSVRPLDAATVAALNITDILLKERAAAENLRQQLKQALDELAESSRQNNNQGKNNNRRKR
jgi:cell division protein ZapA (FtsZ GTPase activity inhibitor)